MASRRARHLHLGGDLREALEAAWAAGRFAEATPAFEEAYANYRRVLDVMDRVDHDLDPVDVLRRAAHTAQLIGREQVAVQLLQEALDRPAAQSARAELLERLGFVHFMAGRGELADEALQAAGLCPYEVSNWSTPGHECRHNRLYWDAGDYLGFGCAAHSHRGGRRWWNLRTPERYLDAVEAGAPTEAAMLAGLQMLV